MTKKIILFTHADPFQQHQLKLSYLDLERSLKNTVLLFGKTTLPGSSVLRSDLTYKLLLNAKDLLKKGLIIPDLRYEYKSFGNYYEKNKKQFKANNSVKERACFLDDNTKNIISFPATEISDFLENNLISSLFYLKLDNQIKIKWSDFTDFVNVIKKPGISDRAKFLEQLNKIAKPDKIILSTTQALYHTLGAFITESHPIWPQLYSEAFKTIRLAQHNSEAKIKQSKEAASFMKRYTFITSVQELNTATNKKIYNAGLKGMHNLSFMNNETLDALDWSDIIQLSMSRTAGFARRNIFKKSERSDHIDLSSLLQSERRSKQRFSKIAGGITLASLITGGAGCIDNPAIMGGGMSLSIAGLLLTLGDILIESEVQRRINSYSMLGEQITKRAVENRTSERLINI